MLCLWRFCKRLGAFYWCVDQLVLTHLAELSAVLEDVQNSGPVCERVFLIVWARRHKRNCLRVADLNRSRRRFFGSAQKHRSCASLFFFFWVLFKRKGKIQNRLEELPDQVTCWALSLKSGHSRFCLDTLLDLGWFGPFDPPQVDA